MEITSHMTYAKKVLDAYSDFKHLLGEQRITYTESTPLSPCAGIDITGLPLAPPGKRPKTGPQYLKQDFQRIVKALEGRYGFRVLVDSTPAKSAWAHCSLAVDIPRVQQGLRECDQLILGYVRSWSRHQATPTAPL